LRVCLALYCLETPFPYRARQSAEWKSGREIFGNFGRRVILPVAAIIAGAMGIVVAFLVVTASQQDAIALDASTRLAGTAVAVKQHEIGRNLKDYAGWQDAYQNLHVKLNTEWAAADGNVGANVYHSLGYEMAFVVARVSAPSTRFWKANLRAPMPTA
jgi:hypothetical protein